MIETLAVQDVPFLKRTWRNVVADALKSEPQKYVRISESEIGSDNLGVSIHHFKKACGLPTLRYRFEGGYVYMTVLTEEEERSLLGQTSTVLSTAKGKKQKSGRKFRSHQPWTSEEDQALRNAYRRFTQGLISKRELRQSVPGRSVKAVESRIETLKLKLTVVTVGAPATGEGAVTSQPSTIVATATN